MDKIRIRKLISNLAKRDYRRMYMNDFFLTWEKTDDEIAATFLVAEILRGPAGSQHLLPDVRFRARYLPVPRQLHAYPVQLRQRLQPARP